MYFIIHIRGKEKKSKKCIFIKNRQFLCNQFFFSFGILFNYKWKFVDIIQMEIAFPTASYI